MSKAFVISTNFSFAVRTTLGQLDRYSAAAQQNCKNAIRQGTHDLYDAVIIRAADGPTGNLRQGIKSDYNALRNEGSVRSTAPHGHLVEFGTRQRIVMPMPPGRVLRLRNGDFVSGVIPAGRMPAKPFMRPAIEQERPKIETAIEEALKNVSG